MFLSFCKKSKVYQNSIFFLLVALALNYPAFGQQIITDGNTNTSMDVKSSTTNITTTTINGSNAFNSFSKFNVDQGNTVNLVIPDASERLINIVKDEASNINGVLNSIQKGKIGGNIYLVNPFGVIVGKEGVINVGNLNIVTPTKSYTDSFFDSKGSPGINAVNSLLDGSAPINPEAVLNIEGKINSNGNVNISAGSLNLTGEIRTGAKFEPVDIQTSDMVNTEDLVTGDNIVIANGEVRITTSGNATVDGKIITEGADNTNAGSINIVAGRDLLLGTNSIVSARGKGENSNGANIYISGNNVTTTGNAEVNAKGGEKSGYEGSIWLNAENNFADNGGYFLLGSNSEVVTRLDNPVVFTGSSTTVNSSRCYDGYSVKYDFTTLIEIGNSSATTISTRNIHNEESGETLYNDNETDASMGDSGYIQLMAPQIKIHGGSKLLSFATGSADPGNLEILDEESFSVASKLEVDNARIRGGNVAINAYDIGTEGIIFSPDIVTSSSFVSNFISNGGPINMSSSANIKLGNTYAVEINSSHNHLFPTTISLTSTGSGSITIGTGLTRAINNVTITSDDLNFESGGKLWSQGDITVFTNSPITVASSIETSYLGTCDGTGSLPGPGKIVIGRISNGDFTVGNTGIISNDVISKISTNSLYIGNYTGITTATQNIILSDNIDLTSHQYINSLTLSGTGNIAEQTQDATADITCKYLTLLSGSGNIGDATNALEINSDIGVTGAVNVTATTDGGVINLTETSGPLYVGSMTTDSNHGGTVGDIILTDTLGSIVDGLPGEGLNLTAKNITLTASDSIGASGNDLNIDSDHDTSGGKLTATAVNIINIREETGHLYLNDVRATGASGSVKVAAATHSILDGSATENANITAASINIEAVTGGGASIGLFNDSVDIDLQGSNGNLTAQSSGYIGIEEKSGDMNLYLASNIYHYDINLKAAGNILDANPYEGAGYSNIYGKNVTLTSTNGTIGSTTQDLDIDSNYGGTTDGRLTTTATGFVNIEEVTGSLYLNNVTTGIGTESHVYLKSNGAIIDGTVDENANITGRSVVLSAPNNSIGLTGAAGDIDINTNLGFLDVQALGYISVNEVSGNLGLYYASNLNGGTCYNINISAPNGSILNSRSDGLMNVYGDFVTLTANASGTIGLASNYLKVDRLSGYSFTGPPPGSIYVNLY